MFTGYRKARLLLALAGLGVTTGLLHAADEQAVPRPHNGVLYLRTGDVDCASVPNLLDGTGVLGPGVHVVVLDGPGDPSRTEALRRAGVRPLGYLPLHAYLAECAGADRAALRALGFVRWVGEFRREWKIEPELLAGGRVPLTPERRAIHDAGDVVVSIWLFAGRDSGNTQAVLSRWEGVRVTTVERVGRDGFFPAQRRIVAVMPRTRVAALADLGDVQFVEEFPEYTLRSNSTTRWVVQSNVPSVTPFYGRGLTGQGQIVGIIDGRVAIDHCSFLDPVNPIGPDHRKILAYNTATGYNAHGTHVAGTAVGDAGAWSDTRGIAYDARMVYNNHPDATEASVYARFELHTLQGATIHSNSWGADWTRAYDGGTRAIDRVSRDYEDILIVHAVSDSALVTNPENAKNSLAVTASQQHPNQQNWCIGGTGPTLDGRRKPEVAAPGCAIASSTGSSGCATAALTGTSMACPAVAGAAALVRQYFTSGFYPSGQANAAHAFSPSGQLVKAMLVNSAVDMTGVAGFPSDREGWGRVLADDAAYFAGDARRLFVRDVRNASGWGLNTGQSTSYPLEVGSGQSLKITLAWADEAAEVNATFVPVNDLDLRVVAPDGQTYLGNVFSAGQSTTGGTPDFLNNLEQVLISAPQAGRWRIEITGAEVNVGVQGFALVVTGDVAEVVCDADVNCDGSVDGFDVEVLEQAVAGDLSNFCAPDADFNGDGSVDGFDVESIEQVIAGGACP